MMSRVKAGVLLVTTERQTAGRGHRSAAKRVVSSGSPPRGCRPRGGEGTAAATPEIVLDKGPEREHGSGLTT